MCTEIVDVIAFVLTSFCILRRRCNSWDECWTRYVGKDVRPFVGPEEEVVRKPGRRHMVRIPLVRRRWTGQAADSSSDFGREEREARDGVMRVGPNGTLRRAPTDDATAKQGTMSNKKQGLDSLDFANKDNVIQSRRERFEKKKKYKASVTQTWRSP